MCCRNRCTCAQSERLLSFSSERHLFTLADGAALEERLIDAVRKNVVQRERFLIYETPLFLWRCSSCC